MMVSLNKTRRLEACEQEHPSLKQLSQGTTSHYSCVWRTWWTTLITEHVPLGTLRETCLAHPLE